MKVLKKNRVLGIGATLFILLLSVAFVFRSRIVSLPDELSCRLKGHVWYSCNTPGFECMFAGCRVVFTGDENKECTGSKDCQSKQCLILNGDKPDSDGLYRGKCKTEISETDFNTGIPEVICGTASIDQGKIVEDMRNCLY